MNSSSRKGAIFIISCFSYEPDSWSHAKPAESHF